MTKCDCRDSCLCHGPIPLCVHGYFGPQFGTPDTLPAADGSILTVYRVTPDDCARCPYPSQGLDGVFRDAM